MKQRKESFVCNQCEYSFKLENDLENHMEYVHKGERSSEHIEQLDGHNENSLPSSNSFFKDGLKSPIDQINEPIDEENDLAHGQTAKNPPKDGPEIKMIEKRMQELDPEILSQMSTKELLDLNAKISRNITLEMQLKRIPPCDSSNLKLAVSKFMKKHMKV